MTARYRGKPHSAALLQRMQTVEPRPVDFIVHWRTLKIQEYESGICNVCKGWGETTANCRVPFECRRSKQLSDAVQGVELIQRSMAEVKTTYHQLL